MRAALLIAALVSVVAVAADTTWADPPPRLIYLPALNSTGPVFRQGDTISFAPNPIDTAKFFVWPDGGTVSQDSRLFVPIPAVFPAPAALEPGDCNVMYCDRHYNCRCLDVADGGTLLVRL